MRVRFHFPTAMLRLGDPDDPTSVEAKRVMAALCLAAIRAHRLKVDTVADLIAFDELGAQDEDGLMESARSVYDDPRSRAAAVAMVVESLATGRGWTEVEL